MINKLITAVFLLTFCVATFAQTENNPPARCPATETSTVFVADKTGSRQKGSAKKISGAHDDAESRGWDFKDLEIYIEDGDLQGFFITYTRPHSCNKRGGN